MDNRFITIKDTDVDILDRLSIVDLYHTCHVNRYTLDVCQQDTQLKLKLHAYDEALNLIDGVLHNEVSEFRTVYIDMDNYRILIKSYSYLFPTAVLKTVNNGTTFHILNNRFYIDVYFIKDGAESIVITKNDMINIVAMHIYLYPFSDITPKIRHSH